MLTNLKILKSRFKSNKGRRRVEEVISQKICVDAARL